MKTKTSTFGIKGLAATAIIASSLTLGVLAQPSHEENSSVAKYLKQLEIFVANNEKALKYEAPDEATEEKQVNEAIDRLNQLSESTDASLKYSAPVEMEDQSVQNLEQLASNSIEQLKYNAPSETEEINNNEEPMFSTADNTQAPVKSSISEPTIQESWLIDAGYVKPRNKQNRF